MGLFINLMDVRESVGEQKSVVITLVCWEGMAHLEEGTSQYFYYSYVPGIDEIPQNCPSCGNSSFGSK